MISAQELRIGSFIHFNGKKHIITIEDLNRIYYKTIFGYQPIPLTEEILLKCGFMITESFFEILLENKSKFNGTPRNCYITKIVIDLEMKLMWFTCVGGNSVCVNMPESLHLFQNFVYSMSGQELNVDNLK